VRDQDLQQYDRRSQRQVGTDGKQCSSASEALESRIANSFDRERQEPDSEGQPDCPGLARDADGAEQEGEAGYGCGEQDPDLPPGDRFSRRCSTMLSASP